MKLVYLLVLMFPGDPLPAAHVYASFESLERCERFAKDFNEDKRIARTAMCVTWKGN